MYFRVICVSPRRNYAGTVTDILLVALAVVAGYVVKLVSPRIGWFDRLMAAKISWKYVAGLARFLKRG